MITVKYMLHDVNLKEDRTEDVPELMSRFHTSVRLASVEGTGEDEIDRRAVRFYLSCFTEQPEPAIIS